MERTAASFTSSPAHSISLVRLTSSPAPMAVGLREQAIPAADTHDYWKKDSTSVSAVSFGFVATAVLIFLFLIVAIFERFLGRAPSADMELSSSVNPSSTGTEHGAFRYFPFFKSHAAEPASVEKCHALEISVLMPGQKVPTFIANPAPIPCSREGMMHPVLEGAGRSAETCTAEDPTAPTRSVRVGHRPPIKPENSAAAFV